MSERGPGEDRILMGGRDSCLLLPGLSGMAQARRLAENLHESGFTVSLPDPGFCRETSGGRSPSNWRIWLDEAREEFVRLDRTMDSVAVAGIGIGGALALILAAEYPVSSVALVAPALRMPGFLGLWGSPYGCEGVRLRDLQAVARLARRSLFAVVAPVLVAEPERGDVHPSCAKAVLSGVSSREKRVEWLTQSRHEFPSEAEFPLALAAMKNHLRPDCAPKALVN
jgi:carboxylesterase